MGCPEDRAGIIRSCFADVWWLMSAFGQNTRGQPLRWSLHVVCAHVLTAWQPGPTRRMEVHGRFTGRPHFRRTPPVKVATKVCPRPQ